MNDVNVPNKADDICRFAIVTAMEDSPNLFNYSTSCQDYTKFKRLFDEMNGLANSKYTFTLAKAVTATHDNPTTVMIRRR